MYVQKGIFPYRLNDRGWVLPLQYKYVSACISPASRIEALEAYLQKPPWPPVMRSDHMQGNGDFSALDYLLARPLPKPESYHASCDLHLCTWLRLHFQDRS